MIFKKCTNTVKERYPEIQKRDAVKEKKPIQSKQICILTWINPTNVINWFCSLKFYNAWLQIIHQSGFSLQWEEAENND